MKIINCVGNYEFSPHDIFGNLKGFTITLETSMPVPDWLKDLGGLEKHHLRVNLTSLIIECDAYIKACKIDIYTHLITEITLCTTGIVIQHSEMHRDTPTQ